MNQNLITDENVAWWYYGESSPKNVGKFMTFIQGSVSDELQSLVLKAIEQGATTHVKHTNPGSVGMSPLAKGDTSVIVWYSSDDKESLKRLASFMVENGLVPRTKKGRYYNISFKYDIQTTSGEYGANFKSAIKLHDLMDLNTGVFY